MADPSRRGFIVTAAGAASLAGLMASETAAGDPSFMNNVPEELLAGDELCHTQKGNNNAYCQDSEISWLSWELTKEQKDFLAFVKRCVKIWDEQPVLQRRKFFQGRKIRGVKDITWLEPSGKEMSDEAWDANWQQCLGVRLAGDMIPELDERGQKISGDTLVSLFNAHHEMIPFTLPPLPEDQQWQLLLDTTSAANDNLFLAGGASYPLQGRSVAVLRQHRLGEDS